MFKVLSHQTYTVSVGADCKFFKYPDYGNTMVGLGLEYKTK
jgi:hypothetical protein